jgi:hypothetical protein
MLMMPARIKDSNLAKKGGKGKICGGFIFNIII